MATQEELRNWVGHDLLDSDNQKVGKIEEIYFDDATGEPEFVSVSTGLFGHNVSFVPLSGTTSQGDVLVTRWTKEKIKGAPNVAPDQHLEPEEEDRLYAYYELAGGEYARETNYSRGDVDTSRKTADLGTDTGYDASGPETDSAMTRSEEELHVARTRREAGKARLRKWIETEHAAEQVTVAKETVRVEREPITDANIGAAKDGPELSEEVHEMPIYDEEVVAETKVVPKERVRLDKDVVTDTETVEADLRKERIELDADSDVRSR